jgi:ATP-dependent exoDNAse (exonuclease V) alpha subunit
VGTTPGHVTVTVFADQSGESYNVGPVSRFTIPGLKSSPAMYSNVYAQSSSAMTGGFSGTRPAAAAGAIAAAQTQVRAQLQQQAEALAQPTASTSILSGLMTIVYQDLPETTEAGGGVRIHEQAHVEIPQLDAETFAQAVAQGVNANAEGASINFVPSTGLTVSEVNATSTTLGTDPIEFTLSGTAQLVWNVDAQALASALAGRDQGAFDTIANGFPGVQEAHARIEPFWKSSFPSNPADIVVNVGPPQSSK